MEQKNTFGIRPLKDDIKKEVDIATLDGLLLPDQLYHVPAFNQFLTHYKQKPWYMTVSGLDVFKNHPRSEYRFHMFGRLMPRVRTDDLFNSRKDVLIVDSWDDVKDFRSEILNLKRYYHLYSH